MTNKKRPLLDKKALSKKYGFSVNQVIKRWKADKNDAEIASELGLDLFKLACLRKDIATEKIDPNKTLASIYMFDRF